MTMAAAAVATIVANWDDAKKLEISVDCGVEMAAATYPRSEDVGTKLGA